MFLDKHTELLDLLCEGLDQSQIADKMSVPMYDIASRLTGMRRDYDCKNSVELAVKYTTYKLTRNATRSAN